MSKCLSGKISLAPLLTTPSMTKRCALDKNTVNRSVLLMSYLAIGKMYILDTDHISILDRGGSGAQILLTKLACINPHQITTTIVTDEEQMRGWLSYIAKADSITAQIIAYRKLENQLANYRNSVVISFDNNAGSIFQDLGKLYPRLSWMDRKIAAIAIVNEAILLTRNAKDFGQIDQLVIEDWTA